MSIRVFLIVYSLILTGICSFLKQEKTLEDSIQAGSEIYQDFCVQCHLQNGEGVSGVFPPLKNSDYLLNDVNRSIVAVKKGLSGKIEVNGEAYDGLMTAQGLTNEEVADVMNYILNSWGNSTDEQVTESKVASVLE